MNPPMTDKDPIRAALLLGREAVVESFHYAKSPDDTYLAEARLRDIDKALSAPKALPARAAKPSVEEIAENSAPGAKETE